MASDTVLDSRLYVRIGLDDARAIYRAVVADRANAGYLASHLLLYDKIVIPTLDFCIVPAMVTWMGMDTFEELLDSSSLRFMRTRGPLAYVGNGNAISTIRVLQGDAPPFQWWQLAVWGDIEQSIELNLKHRLPSLSPSDRSRLLAKVYRSSHGVEYSVPFFNTCVAEESYRDVIASPVLTSMMRGPEQIELRWLPEIGPDQVRILSGLGGLVKDRVDLLLRIAEFNLEVVMATQAGHADIETFDMADHVVTAKLGLAGMEVADGKRLTNLLKATNVPDPCRAVESGLCELADLWRLRQRRDAEQFRRWVRSVTADDEDALTQQYIALLQEEHWVEKLPSRTMRFLITLGAGMINPGAGVAVGAVDSFFVSQLRLGYRPKFFLDQISKLRHL